MPKSWTDEAIVLRTYNVGETDRFCLLLTKHHGRVAARANGVRRLASKRGAGLLPLHHVNVVCEAHSFGLAIASAMCLNNHHSSWSTPQALSSAEQGIELLLQLTDEGVSLESLFALTNSFIEACGADDATACHALFSLRLLTMLGLCPSFTHLCIGHTPFSPTDAVVLSSRYGGLVLRAEDPSGTRVSPALLALLQDHDRLTFAGCSRLSDALLSELSRFVQGLLGSQLGASLKSTAVCFAMSA